MFLILFSKLFSKKIISRQAPNGSTEIYLIRYHLIPNNKYLNIYLHNFLGSDLDEALHDHPWPSIGVLLNGCYNEHVPKNLKEWYAGSRETKIIKRYPFIPVYRSADTIHRIELIDNKPVWTLFITGKWTRNWGFWCSFGFVDNENFLTKDGTSVGKGCNQ